MRIKNKNKSAIPGQKQHDWNECRNAGTPNLPQKVAADGHSVTTHDHKTHSIIKSKKRKPNTFFFIAFCVILCIKNSFAS